MTSCLRLPFHFCSELLKADLSRIRQDQWTPHYNERDYGGDWRGAALRSLSGSSADLAAHGAEPSAFADTPLLDGCPYFREVLSLFQSPLKSARLLSLSPDSFVREHSDPGFGAPDGDLRIHIPIQTNSRVEFYLEGERLLLEEGHCYYIDTSRPHRVFNRGGEDRIHLVIDLELNEWARGILEQGKSIERIPAAPASFDEFRRLVFSNPRLARELHEIPDRETFLGGVVQLGARNGFGFDSEDLSSGNYSKPEKSRALSLNTSGWLPVGVRFQEATPSVEWAYFGSRRLVEPFFEDSVRAVLRNPFARSFRVETPLQFSNVGPIPSGFIFHMSRCGSTLIAQMLAALPRAVVVSEAPPIDAVIQYRLQNPSVSEEEQIAWLQSIVTSLGQPRNGEDLYFVKLDAWHIHSLPLFRQAFPDTPWIFLYRDPVEVLVSQSRQPGQLALPGAMDPSIFGLGFEDVIASTREQWCARVLAGLCRSALNFRDDPKGMFLDYHQLPEAVWDMVGRHFSVCFSADDLAKMRDACRFDAKNPEHPFQADREVKQREAGTDLRDLAGVMVPLYQELQNSSKERI